MPSISANLTDAMRTSVAVPSRPAAGEDTRAVEVPHPQVGSRGSCPFHQAASSGDVKGLRDVASQIIRDRMFGDDSYARAEKVLQKALGADPADAEGETNLELGRVYFLMERWGDAVGHLEVSLTAAPDNADAKALLARAQTNIRTRVDRPMGPVDNFERDQLLLPPALHLRTPELAERADERRGLIASAAEGFRDLSGKALGKVTDLAVKAAGALGSSDEVWTRWDESPGLIGALMIANTRQKLNDSALEPTYRGLVGHQQPGQKRPDWTERVRTATGAWTTDDPMEGAAGTEFGRQGAGAPERRNRALDPTLPNVREVSRAMLEVKGERQTVPFLNTLAIAWIQFQTHDWVNHRPSVSDGAYRVPLAEDDPLRRRYGVDAMFVPRSAENPLPQEDKLTYLNEVTHWWDGSQIYGSDQQTQDRLRTSPSGTVLADGKLRIDADELPLNPQTGVEDTGFSRNWWVGLNLFHTLFVKHHNHICDVLEQAHPDWSSDQLFHTARLVNSATLAKIHTTEWTPAVLPNRTLARGMSTNWWGLLESRKPFSERRVHGALEPTHEILGGLVGGKRDDHGVPYALSEEFVEVYRLHAGLPDALELRAVTEDAPSGSVPLVETRGAGARSLSEAHGMGTLFNSLGHQKMGALVNNNYPRFMHELTVDGNAAVDLGAVDILRARERGVPAYNEFRRMLGLNPLRRYEDLGCDAATVARLESLYGPAPEGLEKMDLLVGTSTEALRPEHFGFGETMFQVFIQMASRRLEADPFYTEKFNEAYYSKEGLELVESSTLKELLQLHFPELRQSGLVNVNNAFEPWGTTAATHPEEHPLTVHGEKY